MQDLIAELTGGRLNIRVAAIIRNQDNILAVSYTHLTLPTITAV